jgi:hypothetical protein
MTVQMDYIKMAFFAITKPNIVFIRVSLILRNTGIHLFKYLFYWWNLQNIPRFEYSIITQK